MRFASPTIFGMKFPYSWTEALHRVQRKNPEAVIAGPCIRDVIFGICPESVDFFLIDDREVGLNRIFRRQPRVWIDEERHPEFTGIVNAYEEVDGGFMQRTTVSWLEFKGGWSAAGVADRFCMGASQVAFNGEKFFISDDAENDFLARRISFSPYVGDKFRTDFIANDLDYLRQRYKNTDVIIDDGEEVLDYDYVPSNESESAIIFRPKI